MIQLADIGFFAIKWKIVPPDASLDPEHETIRLCLNKSKIESKKGVRLIESKRSYEQKRNIYYGSKKMMKQQLCATALDDLCSNSNHGSFPDWAELSFNELKEHLSQNHSIY